LEEGSKYKEKSLYVLRRKFTRNVLFLMLYYSYRIFY